MLEPKRTKFRKYHRGRRKGKANRGNKIIFGDYALQASQSCWLTAKQIEAGRRVIARYTKREGKLWIRVFPDKSITRRPAETRMGSGKGNPEYWIAVLKPRKIIYEITGVSEKIARKAMKIASYKLPIQTHFLMIN
nr:ribosomal protein L16 [Ostreobium quekettii]